MAHICYEFRVFTYPAGKKYTFEIKSIYGIEGGYHLKKCLFKIIEPTLKEKFPSIRYSVEDSIFRDITFVFDDPADEAFFLLYSSNQTFSVDI